MASQKRSMGFSLNARPGNEERGKSLSDYPKTKSSRGEKLNPSGQVPEKGFQAYYIDTNKPDDVISTENVKDIGIDYIYDSFHGIDSKNFGAYWVGEIRVEKWTTYRITIDQSWSNTRIIINGAKIYEGGADKEILVNLERGRYRVEVEYENNWHTTKFSLKVFEPPVRYSYNEIKERLRRSVSGKYDIYYVGLHKSANENRSVVLNLEKTSSPVVLFLNSYSPVNWFISNPFDVNVRAIVYGSYESGASVSGGLDKSVLLVAAEEGVGSHYVTSECKCTVAGLHCEEGNLLSTKNAIEELTGATLRRLTGKYSASSIQVPELNIYDRLMLELENRNGEMEALHEFCRKSNYPDIENRPK